MSGQVVCCGGADDAGANDYDVFLGRGSGHGGDKSVGYEAEEMFGRNGGGRTFLGKCVIL